VLEREPEHAAARTLLARLEDEAYVAPPPPLPPEPEVEPELAGDEEEEGVELEAAPSVPAAHEHEEEPEEEEADALDECIAIPVARDASGNRMYVRWSVSRSTSRALLAAMPSARFVVRAHIVTPSWDTPTAETRDLVAPPEDGKVTLVGLPEPSVVRVAVGWLEGAKFVPVAHSPSLEMTERRGLVIWTPKGAVPVIMGDPRADAIARAVDEAQRSTQARP
jgi:hypothetical protein